MKKSSAVWTISLDCVCPCCHTFVDLLNHPDFWADRAKLALGETGTPATKNMQVICPECKDPFTVDLEQ